MKLIKNAVLAGDSHYLLADKQIMQPQYFEEEPSGGMHLSNMLCQEGLLQCEPYSTESMNSHALNRASRCVEAQEWARLASHAASVS